MVRRIHNLDKWKWWAPGKPLALRSEDDAARLITIKVNCSERTLFHVEAGGVLCLLGTVEGVDTFEITAGGLVELTAQPATAEGLVMYQTEDGRDVTVVLEESAVFTRIMQRPARNRHQEWVEYQTLAGQRRRDAQLADARAAEVARMRAEILADLEKRNAASAPAPVDPPAPSAAGGGGEQTPPAPAPSPAPGA